MAINVSNSIVSGTINENTVWSGNITLSGSVKISTGASLTINPGTVITVTSGKDIMLWADTGASLLVNGTDNAKVVFKSNSGQDGDWLGIRLNGNPTDVLGTPKSQILNSEISNAKVGIHVSSQSLLVDDVNFKNNSTAIWIGKSTDGVSITNSNFVKNNIITSYEGESIGPYNTSNSFGEVKNLTISNNNFSEAAISIIPNQRTVDDISIKNNNFENSSQTAIQIGAGGYGSHIGLLDIQGNTINGGAGISLRAYSWLDGGVNISDNSIKNASTGIYFDFSEGTPDNITVKSNIFYCNNYAISGFDYYYSGLKAEITGNLFLQNVSDINVPDAHLFIAFNTFIETNGVIIDNLNKNTTFNQNNIYKFLGTGSLIRTRDTKNAGDDVSLLSNFIDSSSLTKDLADDGSENFLYPIVNFKDNQDSPVSTALNFWRVTVLKNGTVEKITVFDSLGAPIDIFSAPVVSSKALSIAENSIAGKAVGSMTATDADGDAITYSITAGNADVDKDGKAAFAINSSTGAITVNDDGDLNYEDTKTFNLTVKASDGSLSSTATATVNLTNVNEAPTGTVSISGTATEGSKLTVASTLKDPDGAGTANVQWLRDGSPISGATFSSYTLTSADVGKSISARLSYIDGGGFSETRTSAAIVPSGLNPGVSITGSDRVTGEDGDTAVFLVKLNKAPVDPVTVRFVVSDTTEAKLSTSSLTFTSSNWNTTQSLTVTGLDDYDNDGNVAYNLTATVSTDDLSYKRVTVSSIGLINNNDALDAPVIKNGTDGIDYLRGNNGADRLYGKGDMDDIRGGRGDDRIYGENDDDVLYGDDGNDWVYGGYDDDRVYGGAGDDELYGEAGSDRLEGGTGNDYMDGGTGADTMIGGAGNDTYFVDNAKDVIDDQGATTDEDTVIVMATISYKLAANVESAELKDASGDASLTGNTLSNDLTGNGSKNTLEGGGGNDVLDAGAGNDTLLGGDGTDILIGGLGTDTINGGTGDDLVNYTDAAAGFVNVDLSKGTANGDGSDTLISIEDVIGSDGADIIIGNTADNELTGGLGGDNLSSGGGADVLYAGAGNDTLNGGIGKDQLSGGSEKDTFIWIAINETSVSDALCDVILDFAVGSDKISLSGIDASSMQTGNNTFTWRGISAFTTSSNGEVRFQRFDNTGNSNDYTMVYIDTDNDTGVEAAIRLSGLKNFTGTDFFL